MNIDSLNEIYTSKKQSFNTKIFALQNLDNADRFKCDYFPTIQDNQESNYSLKQPSLAIIVDEYINYDRILIIFGYGDKNTFTPSSLEIGNLNISYYKEEIIDDKLIIESDLNTKSTDMLFIKALNLNLRNANLSPAYGIVNFIRALNWFYPYYDAIDLDKFTNLIQSDHWFRSTNIDHYLEEIKSLEWSYRWSSRFKHGEGTIYCLHSILTPPNNIYLTHLIETISEIEIYHSDFANCHQGEMQVTEKEMAEVKFNHLDRSMILGFTNFIKSKYFLSQSRRLC